MLEPDPPVHAQLRRYPLPESVTAALYPNLLLPPAIPETTASPSLTLLLSPVKICRHPIPNYATDPCPILPPSNPRIRCCSLTYHYPPLSRSSFRRCLLPSYPGHPPLNASVGNDPVAIPVSSFTPRSFAPPSRLVRDGRRSKLTNCSGIM